MDHPIHKRSVKIARFYRPNSIQELLGDKEATCFANEIFLASGEGLGAGNITPVETIVKKCNVVCTSRDIRNRPPSEEELGMADFVFSRIFDVKECACSDKLDDIISGIEVKHFLNNKESSMPSGGQKPKGNFCLDDGKLPAFRVSYDWTVDQGIPSCLICKTTKSAGYEAASKPAREKGTEDDLILSTEAGILNLYIPPDTEILRGTRGIKDDRVILNREAGLIYLHMHRLHPIMVLLSGTTVFAIKYKEGIVIAADGLVFKTVVHNGEIQKQRVSKPHDARWIKIEEIGSPTYMLAAASGDNVWFQPLLDAMIEEMGSERWKAMQCATFAKAFLNQKDYTPPEKYGAKGIDLSQMSCRLVFATWESKEDKDPNVLFPTLVCVSKDKIVVIENACCIGSGEPFAAILNAKDFSNSTKEEVTRFVEDLMIDISKKDPGTGGDVNIAHIDSSFAVTFEPVKSVTLLEFERAFHGGMGTSSSPSVSRRRKREPKSASTKAKKKKE